MPKSLLCIAIGLVCCTFSHWALADGKVMAPRDYKGSLEEKAQEAILIFHAATSERNAVQDMILKIEVEGEAEEFAWIVPLPTEPKIAEEDPELFRELFNYVEYRKRRPSSGIKSDLKSARSDGATNGVEVIKREVVGNFEITTVRETAQGGLNPWLEQEGFQTLENAEDVLDFYRDKDYVYACIKIDSKVLATEKTIESHPLRFTFETGGEDGIFFPMKLTGLQKDSFDVNLYVFYSAWLNDNLNKYGFKNRGMQLKYRDWDSSTCEPNGGKNYSLPEEDPFLKSAASRIPTVKKLFQKLHPGERYYLTNIYANNLDPKNVREWSDDLWLFPHYTDRSYVPMDARGPDYVEPADPTPRNYLNFSGIAVIGLSVVGLVLVGFFILFSKGSAAPSGKPGK